MRPETMSSSGIREDDDISVSEDESYFSSKYEPQYLTRLSLALGKDAKPVSNKDDKNSTPSGRSKAQRASTSTRASTTTTASTLSSLSFQSDDVVFNFPVPPSPGFAPSQQLPYQLGSLTHLPKSPISPKSPQDYVKEQDWTHGRSSSEASGALPQVPKLAKPPRRVRKKPAVQLKQQASVPPATRCRTSSDASAALPQWMAEELPIRPETAAVEERSEPDEEGESEFVKKFRARLCAPERQRRAAFGNSQQTAKEALEARNATAKQKKSKVKVTSPALANKLGVSLRSDVDLCVDDINVRHDSDSAVENVITNVRGGSLWSYHF